jgi:organic radical activating enzyme
MLWRNKGKELEKFSKNWKDINDVAIFALGDKGKVFHKEIKEDINIVNFFDNDITKCNQFYEGIKILPVSFLLEKEYHSRKIIISAHYYEIADQLIKLGYKEDEDFCEINKFACMWYWYRKKEVRLPEVHIALTTKCTLNCKHCNMFIPFQQNKGEHIPVEQLIKDLDLFFNLIDRVYSFVIVGGEPFLYPYLDVFLTYLCNNYRNKIGEIRVITNGTIEPKNNIVKILREWEITVSISNYSEAKNYGKKVNAIEERLKYNDVLTIKATSNKWVDFCFPHAPLNITDDAAVGHMHECMPAFKGINNGNFYYCHIVWSAVKCNILKEDRTDYINMELFNAKNLEDRVKLIEYNLGFMEKGFVSLCKQCAGCGASNTRFLESGIQI